ncbi:MAG: hypothetical protein OSJ61_20925 [Lachnospiraceae bacterium]|nr:hypothetical protein [Lachnospiraceae bacterium]
MGTCINIKPKNCNHCIYRKNVSRYLDLEDYCSRNMKHIRKINMDTDCPLRRSKVRKHFMKLFNIFQNRRKAEHMAEDIIQMNTDIVLTDKDGKLIEVKTPEPEYMSDSI